MAVAGECNESIPDTISVTDARRRWSSLVSAVARGGRRVVLARGGAPAAVLVSPSDWARFERYEAERRRDEAAILAMGEAFQDADPDEIEAAARAAVRDVRAEAQAALAGSPVAMPRRPTDAAARG